ncbi:hypothetical protein ILUMI_02044 [Ignelater luminosus]|uniref:STAS domain-containing protein n=1 Tax=Ignelater luminosus TaxID=2038154 RepID=A0A8K0DDF8_IGNLU|nr:hypothetical protein ILUMI_02044 [Ignelater luminosus]
MLAVGLCNIVGCLFSSMPVNASFSRAAVSNASGIRTTIGGIYTGVMVILSLTFLTPYFSYIPKATLASVIICAVLFMVEVSIVKPMWKINKIDWIPLWGTFIACLLLGIEIGILVGVVIDVILLLYYNARPRVTVQKISENGMEYVKITPSSSVLFPSAEYVRELIMKSNIEMGRSSNMVVLDCSKISRADFTSAKVMRRMT